MPNDKQGVGIFTITPTIIEGGQFLAALAGSCKMTCQVYYPQWVDGKEVWNEIKRAIESVSAADDWLKDNPPKLKVDKSIEGREEYLFWGPNKVSVEHPGCQTLATSWKEATGKDAIFSGIKAVDDSTWFGARGIPAVTLGPGTIAAGAHGIDEYVLVDNILRCCKTYAAMAANWCGVTA